MKRNFSDYITVLIVVVCCVVLLAALSIALTGRSVRKPSRVISVDFPDVAGIHLHSDLRYAGAPAGEVIEIRPLTAEERLQNVTGTANAVRVTVAVKDSIPPIASDTVASVSSDTMLSEKYIALSAGSPGAAPLASGAVLPGHPSFDIMSLGSKLDPLLENANATITDVRKQLNIVLPEVANLSKKLEGASDSATALVKKAEALIDNNDEGIHARIEELGTVLANLNGVLAQAKTTLGSADKFIGHTDKEVAATADKLSDLMSELGVVIQNLKVVTTHAKAITESLGEKPSRLIWSGKAKKLTPEEEIIDSSKPVPATQPSR